MSNEDNTAIQNFMLKKEYNCVKCGNKKYFSITISNIYDHEIRNTGLFSGFNMDNPRIVCKLYTLKCQVCKYEITVNQKCDNNESAD